MDVREKLVELLQDENNPVWRWFPNNATMAQLADYLINSGVTVQEWVSVKDRLPEERGMYIVTANDGHAQRVSFVQWQNKNRMWNLTGARSYWIVTHWQPMPQPPKGE